MRENLSFLPAGLLFCMFTSASAPAQMSIDGRVQCPRFEGASEVFFFPDIVGFATPLGSRGQSAGTRTWETEPPGWYYLSGIAGPYTMAFAGPGMFMRPVVATNLFFADGDKVVRHLVPTADYAMLSPAAWDPKRASQYYQTFVARSTSITHVGFKLAHDGIDGPGPGVQNLIASIHRGGPGTPDRWERIGPEIPVLNVNAGGALDIAYAAAWNSGEVPTEPGKIYAVRLRPEQPDKGFQCFWRENAYGKGDCYRVGPEGKGFAGRDQWLYVAGDSDGLLIPYNKRVQREFHALTKFGRKWSQTYVAQGRGLAAVVLYAAIASQQGSLEQQRVVIRLRRGGPDGPVTGIEKIAVGQPTATGQSGVFGVAVAPGEIPLEPGVTYAVEFESFGKDAGFNPVKKQPRDAYEAGCAWFNAVERTEYDLDMVVVEYQHSDPRWAEALEPRDFVVNGDMQRGEMHPDDPGSGGPDGWKRFVIDAGTAFWYTQENGNRRVQVVGGSVSSRTVDGGYVQSVAGLNRSETYRLIADVCSSWPANMEHQAFVGLDATGQDGDPRASSIQWTVLPWAHGVNERYVSQPVRPRTDKISVWLRARTTMTGRQPFVVSFDDVHLQQVRTGVPSSAPSP
jgi:hypothetical protein